MNIHLVAIGDRLPTWANQGYEEYAKRLTQEIKLSLTEVKVNARRKHQSSDQNQIDESLKLLQACPKNSHKVALHPDAPLWSSEQLAQKLAQWQALGTSISLLIGGPDGLSQNCLEQCQERWSLSHLIFPHPLVRVLVAEQIYRGWSILKGHPYHRP